MVVETLDKKRRDAWDKAFSNVNAQAVERAIANLFSQVRDEAIRQALAQGFLAGVDWCFSEQSDADIAKAALLVGVEPEEATTGAIRKLAGERG